MSGQCEGPPVERRAFLWDASRVCWSGVCEALQYEIDHFRETLYIDRMETGTFTTLDN
jgi:hypothetical protein